MKMKVIFNYRRKKKHNTLLMLFEKIMDRRHLMTGHTLLYF